MHDSLLPAVSRYDDRVLLPTLLSLGRILSGSYFVVDTFPNAAHACCAHSTDNRWSTCILSSVTPGSVKYIDGPENTTPRAINSCMYIHIHRFRVVSERRLQIGGPTVFSQSSVMLLYVSIVWLPNENTKTFGTIPNTTTAVAGAFFALSRFFYVSTSSSTNKQLNKQVVSVSSIE